MKRRWILALGSVVLFSLNACAAFNHFDQKQSLYDSNTTAHTFKGMPEIGKLNPQVLKHNLFRNAPKRHVAVLNYSSREIPSGNPYSKYQIKPMYSDAHITRYKTVEKPVGAHGMLHIPDMAAVRGAGVGSGGIFSLAYIKSESNNGHMLQDPRFYIHYEITSISDVSGELFPLQLGNKLRFHYTAVGKHNPNDKRVFKDSGTMMYEVIKHEKGYSHSSPTIAGDIYVVRFSQSTKSDRTLTRLYDYTYSNDLGWYIESKYYINAQPAVKYRLDSYKKA